MGQQQLLLLVLGLVTVGLAVIAGIEAFSYYESDQRDSMAENTALRLSTDAIEQYMKPRALGGFGEKIDQPKAGGGYYQLESWLSRRARETHQFAGARFRNDDCGINFSFAVGNESGLGWGSYDKVYVYYIYENRKMGLGKHWRQPECR